MQSLRNKPMASEAEVLGWLSDVPDPEIPVLSVIDLGIVRSVRVAGDEIAVAVAPTYSGCPATEVIERSIIAALEQRGFSRVTLSRELSPPWTTDWITDAGRDKLRAYGIAPPARGSAKRALLDGMRQVRCPRCESTDTSLVSEFGSTACKAAYRCDACSEPFEYFKCI